MAYFLTTRRLGLRAFSPDDLDNLVALDSDPEVMRYLTGGRATPRAEAAKTLAAMLAPRGAMAAWAWAAEYALSLDQWRRRRRQRDFTPPRAML